MSISEDKDKINRRQNKIQIILCREEHYNRLVNYQEEEGIEFLKTFVSRVRFEDELECLLAQLIGARDALLFRIKEKLRLQLKDKDVHLYNINRKLFHTKNQRFL